MGRLRGSEKISLGIIMTMLAGAWLCSCHAPSEDDHKVSPPAQAARPGAELTVVDRSLDMGTERYRYTVSVPSMWNAQRTWPIIVFLHGLDKGRKEHHHGGHGFGNVLRHATPPLPVVVVLPHCLLPHVWHEPDMQTMVMQALRQAIQEFHGDEQRLYLVGHSLGGYGVWTLAAAHPGLFAALVPIGSSVRLPSAGLCQTPLCGNTSTTNLYLEVAQKIGKTPVWMFHGAKDPLVPVSDAREMFHTLQSLGANVRYTEYADLGHRCWKRAYAEPELLPWLLNQHQGQ